MVDETNLLEIMRQRLDMVRKLNLLLIEARDEREFVISALELINNLVGAEGISYTPFDDYGQPLPVITIGSLPDLGRQSWEDQLISPQARDHCKICEKLHATSQEICPLTSLSPSKTINVECLPVLREDRVLGMVNLYLLESHAFDEDNRSFFQGIINEIAIAVDSIHLRNKELNTLRQLSKVRPSKIDLMYSLNELLDQVLAILEADFAWLDVFPISQSPHSIRLTRGRIVPPITPFLENLASTVAESEEPVVIEKASDEATFPAGPGVVVVTRLNTFDHTSPGVLGVGLDHPYAFHPDQLSVLQLVASQAGQLIEQDRLLLQIEYQAVVKERTRLAREIHDGLAQTLAFLKIQTGQMQNYLAHSDLTRLNQALQSNYQALADAYLDIRQSIDNLRLTPQEGMQNWLEQIAAEFRLGSGLQVYLDLSVPPSLGDFSPEIQAQLIRIVQEALSNVRKHAHASQVWITLHEWSRNLIIEIRDDGQGFSPEDVPGLSQYGLRGMRERAELIGADFQIISQPHQGTTVSIHLPIPFEESVV